MFGDLTQGGGRDSLQCQLGLLEAEDQKADSAGINDGLSELVGVLGDASEGPGSGFFDGGVKLLEAVDEGVEGSRVDDSLGQVGRVLGNRSEDVGSSLFVESLNKGGRLNICHIYSYFKI